MAIPEDARRRPLLIEPGEPLLLSRNALDVLVRRTGWIEATGIDEAHTFSTPALCIPLPLYEANWPERGLRRWAGTRASAMWHPLMWLPRSLSHRGTIRTVEEDGTTIETVEPLDVWALRVALELFVSGMYDITTGGWVDILATVDLDIDDPADEARVQRWLEGFPDPVLDDVDLSPWFHNADNENWALQAALDLRDFIIPASWAAAADSLYEYLDTLYSTEGELDDAEFNRRVEFLVAAGASLLGDTPIAETPDHPAFADSRSFWADVTAQVERVGRRDTLLSAGGVLEVVGDHLYETREDHWPAVEHLARMGDDGSTDDEVVDETVAEQLALAAQPTAQSASTPADEPDALSDEPAPRRGWGDLTPEPEPPAAESAGGWGDLRPA